MLLQELDLGGTPDLGFNSIQLLLMQLLNGGEFQSFFESYHALVDHKARLLIYLASLNKRFTVQLKSIPLFGIDFYGSTRRKLHLFVIMQLLEALSVLDMDICIIVILIFFLIILRHKDITLV